MRCGAKVLDPLRERLWRDIAAGRKQSGRVYTMTPLPEEKE
jgi:hypothetical protein